MNACVPKAKVAPVMPSNETTSFNFSFFEQNYKDNTHFSFVANKVLEWKPFLEDSISVHHAIMDNAEINEFKFQKDNTWLNSFSFNNDGEDKYDAKFFGIFEADTVLYKTFLSYDTISDIVYLDGSAYQDNKIGQWFLNKSKVDGFSYISSKILSIDWDFSVNKHILFTNNQAGSNNLNYILYIDSVDNEFDAYLDVYSKGDQNHSIIQWNTKNKNGRVKDNLRFNNEDWYYWDNNLQDISKK